MLRISSLPIFFALASALITSACSHAAGGTSGDDQNVTDGRVAQAPSAPAPAPTPPTASRLRFHGDLDPANETLAPNVGGKSPTASADFVFDATTKRLCGRLQWKDLTADPTGIHVHQAPPGSPEADGVAPQQEKLDVPLGASPIAINVALSDAFVTSLLAEEVYVNIHTAANPKGELRSTLFRVEAGADIPCDVPSGS